MKLYRLYKKRIHYIYGNQLDFGCIGVFDIKSNAIDYISLDSWEKYNRDPYKVCEDYYSVNDPYQNDINYFYEIIEKEEIEKKPFLGARIQVVEQLSQEDEEMAKMGIKMRKIAKMEELWGIDFERLYDCIDWERVEDGKGKKKKTK